MTRIGIMGAMPQEISGVLELLENVREESIAGRTYYCGTISSREVVVVFSHWGKVAAAITTTTLIRTFGVDALIFTGVAGAISPELRIGDIVVADELIQHDFDARPITPRFEIPLVGKARIPSDNALSNLAYSSVYQLIENNDSALRRELSAFSGNEAVPELKRGLIASGDQFFSSEGQREELRNLLPDVLCVEMEGAAVAQVCYESKIPFCIIRTISDEAGHQSAIDFLNFIKQVASTYSRGIIVKMLGALV